MSQFYNPNKTYGNYKKDSREPFKVSRSKIDLFIECPRCFYLDKKIGIGRPPGYPFTLNSAVDQLLKQEFDIYRVQGSKHPLIEKYGVDAKPIPHKDLEKWRHNFTGVQFLHRPTNFLVFGAIDDLWQNSKGEYIVVDYKATAKSGKITALDKDWHDGYKRQMEVYQWLLRQNGYKVSDTGYFVYCNGQADRKAFDGKLEFDITLIPYKGDSSWVDEVLVSMKQCLDDDDIPQPHPDCDYCAYTQTLEEKLNRKDL